MLDTNFLFLLHAILVNSIFTLSCLEHDVKIVKIQNLYSPYSHSLPPPPPDPKKNPMVTCEYVESL